jgi:hypothetical protein
MNSVSGRIARIIGPTAIALAMTEAVNMHIFAAQTAPVVYLNGTLLFVGGVAIVQAHNRWGWGWPLLVTLTGWGLTTLGLIRMIAPEAALHRNVGARRIAFLVGLPTYRKTALVSVREVRPARDPCP